MTGEASLVQIQKINGTLLKQISADQINSSLKNQNICILLSPFIISPLDLSAQIDALQAQGAQVSIAVLGNYIFNDLTAENIDYTTLSPDNLKQKLTEGDQKLQERLDKEFDSENYPGVSFNKVIMDHQVQLHLGSYFEQQDGFKELKETYTNGIKDQSSTLYQNLQVSASQYAKKHYHERDLKLKQNNSKGYLNIEGPQYAEMAKQFDGIAYLSYETPLLKSCRELIPENERAFYIECQIAKSIKLDFSKIQNPQAIIKTKHERYYGVSLLKYSLPESNQQNNAPSIEEETDPYVVLRKRVRNKIVLGEYHDAIQAIDQLDTSKWSNEHLVFVDQLLDFISRGLQEAAKNCEIEKKQGQLAEQKIQVETLRFFNGHGLQPHQTQTPKSEKRPQSPH